MGVVVVIPALISIWYLVHKSHREAFLYVYVTCLLSLPGWCRWVLPGVPDPTFHEMAIMPIAVAYLVKGRKTWRFSLLDIPVFSLLLVMAYSEYYNAGFKEAQNLMFDAVCASLLPYVLAKGIIQPNGLAVPFVRRFVWSLAIVACVVPYEFRFGLNPYRIVFDRFFPGQGDGWVTTFRYGFVRVAGPYGHAILAGLVFLIGLILQLWLAGIGAWEPRFRNKFLNLKKPLVLTLALLGTLAITFTRGPALGAALAWVVRWVGLNGKPHKRLRILILVAIFIGVPIAIWFLSYISVEPMAKMTETQQTAVYRKELIDKYEQIALQHVYLGWGRNGWPKVPGMPSIDNFYLLLSLMHGLTATALLIITILVLIVRLYRNAMKYAPICPKGHSLSFTLLGIYIGFSFAIATVYLGDNLIPIFFMMCGFAEGYVVGGGDRTLAAGAPAPSEVTSKEFQFQRVIA